MLRSLKKQLRHLTKPQFETLKQRTSASKNLYNQALYILKKAYRETEKYISYPEMDKIMKETVNLEGEINYRLLKAQTAQQTLKRLDRSYKSFFGAVGDFAVRPDRYISAPKPPEYIRKEHYNIIYTKQSFQIKNGYAVLEKGLSVRIPGCLIGKEIRQIEIIPKYRCFEAVFVYECTEEYEPAENNGGTMAIDLGLDNLAVCTTDCIVKPFVIDGRKLKSVNQLYNKKAAEKKSVLGKQRPDRKWSKELQRLTDKRSRRVNDCLHKASAAIISICAENGIFEIVIGNVHESLDGISLGKRTNQNFVNISLGQLVSKIRYKAESRGIKVAVTDESYTSKASFIDCDLVPAKYDPGTEHRFRGRRICRGLYRSENGILINADVNGSYNILRKSKPEFTFTELMKKAEEGIAGWLHPCSRPEII